MNKQDSKAEVIYECPNDKCEGNGFVIGAEGKNWSCGYCGTQLKRKTSAPALAPTQELNKDGLEEADLFIDELDQILAELQDYKIEVKRTRTAKAKLQTLIQASNKQARIDELNNLLEINRVGQKADGKPFFDPKVEAFVQVRKEELRQLQEGRN